MTEDKIGPDEQPVRQRAIMTLGYDEHTLATLTAAAQAMGRHELGDLEVETKSPSLDKRTIVVKSSAKKGAGEQVRMLHAIVEGSTSFAVSVGARRGTERFSRLFAASADSIAQRLASGELQMPSPPPAVTKKGPRKAAK